MADSIGGFNRLSGVDCLRAFALVGPVRLQPAKPTNRTRSYEYGDPVPSNEDSRYNVCFVCTGNICRSPVAAVMAERAFEEAGMSDRVRIHSAGVMSYHVGDRADERALRGLVGRGYDGSAHRASKITASDLSSVDLAVALDKGHVTELQRLAAGDRPHRIRLLRSFEPASQEGAEVNDPYYGGPEGFETVMDQVDAALPGLVDHVRYQLDQEDGLRGAD